MTEWQGFTSQIMITLDDNQNIQQMPLSFLVLLVTAGKVNFCLFPIEWTPRRRNNCQEKELCMDNHNFSGILQVFLLLTVKKKIVTENAIFKNSTDWQKKYLITGFNTLSRRNFYQKLFISRIFKFMLSSPKIWCQRSWERYSQI